MTKTTEPPSFERLRQRIEATLDSVLPTDSALSPQLVAAMRYSAQGSGKRIRPLLTCCTCEALTGDASRALAPAAAVELVHAYSLVHDDLPAMDNDVLRRGRPTCHVAFDEATAILTGDALLTLAFDVLAAADGIDSSARIRMVQVIADAAGWNGMVGGQALDIGSTGRPLDSATLERMHRGKTGALVVAAVQLGALAAGATESQYHSLTHFGEHVGLAFQMIDDVLDVTATSVDLGKSAGADARAHKTTFASLLGVEATRDHAERLLDEATRVLEHAGIDGSLKEL